MRALVYRGNDDIRLEDIPEPTPGPGEVLLRVTNCSICATDVEEWKHGPKYITQVPTVMGHEVAGRVAELGPGAEGIAVGERVVVDDVQTCGECYWCLRGARSSCPNMQVAGLGLDGGLEEFMTWPASHVVRLPDAVSDEEAPLLEPATVAVHAVRRSAVRVGETVAVIGIGVVGALALQAFKASGAKVFAVDVRERSLELARELGADAVIDPGNGDAGEALAALTDGVGPDIVAETAGAPGTPVDALRWARRRGTVVLVGIYTAQPEVDFNEVVGKELRVVGSLAAEPGDLAAAVELAATGRLRLSDLVSARIPLERVIPDGFERMLAESKDVFRIIVRPGE